MSTYLELVNKAIRESSSEQLELTSITWSSAEAGRRVYPRIKSNVADAWKDIQMRRNEWEFMTNEALYTDFAHIYVQSGNGDLGPPVDGEFYMGAVSGCRFQVLDIVTIDGSWSGIDGSTATIGLDYSTCPEIITPIIGEFFTNVTSYSNNNTISAKSFQFAAIAGEDFKSYLDIGEIDWETFYAAVGGNSSYGPASDYNTGANTKLSPVQYINWQSWPFGQDEFTQSAAPYAVTQSPDGKVFLYPPSIFPTTVKFQYNRVPQILSSYDDEPSIIPPEYHDWIAWEALMKFAIVDKNSNLFTYAKANATMYSNRAERNLMPLMGYSASRYNYVTPRSR